MGTSINDNRIMFSGNTGFVDKYLIHYFLLFPGTVLIFIFVMVPLFLNIIMSFTDYSLINPDYTFVGINNYIELFKSGIIIDTALKTSIWTVGSLIPSLIIGLITSLLMSLNIRFINVLKAAILLPWVLPEVVTGYTWQWMFSGDYGILTHFLIILNIIDESFSFFSVPSHAMTAVIIANIWRSFPFFAIMIYAKLKTLPKEILEAARIDGANSIQIFIHVTISWIMPVAARAMVLGFIWTVNAFSIIFTMTAGGPAGATETVGILGQRLAMRDYNFPIATTLGVVVSVITTLFLISPFIIKKIVKKFHKSKIRSFSYA